MRRAGAMVMAMMLSVALAGCGGGADTGMEEDTAAAVEDTAPAEMTPADTATMEGAEADTMSSSAP